MSLSCAPPDFVNTIFFITCGNHSGWFVLLYLVPIVNIITHAFVCGWVSRAYGHGVGFAVGLFFLPFIFLLILGFDSSPHRQTA